MNMICRIAKKVKLFDGLFTLKKLEIQEGVIDYEGNFVVVNGEEVKKYPIYKDPRFLTKEGGLCYCDERSMDGLIADLDDVKTKKDIFDEYKKKTEDMLYIISYDKENNDSKVLLLNGRKFSQLSDLTEELDNFNKKSIFESPDECFAYPEGAILTTVETLEKLRDLIKNEETEDAIDILNVTINDFKLVNSFSPSKQIYDEEDEYEEKEEKIVPKKERTLEDIINDLNNLIGLENIKGDVSKLARFLKFKEKIKDSEINIELPELKLNMAFLGNPGTGKTTVAKLIAQIYTKLGYSNGKFKEASATDLIGKYVGWTGPKTKKLLKDIRGGVLFLDEAYALTRGADDKSSAFGQEALAELVKEMEKKKTIFIFAGYKLEMESFINANSGLKSRMEFVDFKDYTTEELYTMFKNKVKKANLLIDEEADKKVIELIENARTQKDFGNGRYVDNLFEKIIKEHGNNVADLDDELSLRTLTLNDIDEQDTSKILYKKLEGNKIGF